MKRRDFLRTVGAGAAMGAIPVKAVAAGAAPVASYGMSPYRMARYTARINRYLTPEMLTKFCGISQSEAMRLMRRLTFENVLATPDASGISRVSESYAARIDRRRAAMKRMVQTMREAMEDERDTVLPAQEDRPPEPDVTCLGGAQPEDE